MSITHDRKTDGTQERSVVPPSVKDQLKELILKSLDVRYISTSCQGGIQTGHNYQSILLGDKRTKGFRSDRSEFLDQIDFMGKKVLDLGSNLGEISRAARARGASLVDGFEYDPFFLEVANLINAYNDVSRVSFSQRSITEPSVYGEHYDIVLAFSVFTYIASVLEKIAEITDEVLVVETHRLEDNLEKGYLMPASRYFPYHLVLGNSDWGTSLDEREKRAVIVFAKRESGLAAALKAYGSKTSSASSRSVHTPSPQPPTRAPTTDASSPSELRTRSVEVDLDRTCLQKKFFANFEYDYLDDLFASVSAMQLDLDALAQSRDLKDYQYSGWTYWLLYVKGYLQYVETGMVGRGNIYYDYNTRYFTTQGSDLSLRSYLEDPLAAIERVARRFRDFDFFRNQAAQSSTGPYSPDAVRLITSDPPPPSPLLVYETGLEAPLKVRMVDGWHRLFAAKLCGITKLPGEVVTNEKNDTQPY